jgi:hypothetical protein
MITCQLSKTLGSDGNFLCRTSDGGAQAYRFEDVDAIAGSIRITPGLVRTPDDPKDPKDPKDPLAWAVTIDGKKRSTENGQLVCAWTHDASTHQKRVVCTTDIDGVTTEVLDGFDSLVCTQKDDCFYTNNHNNNKVVQKHFTLENRQYKAEFAMGDKGNTQLAFTWPDVAPQLFPPFAPVSTEFAPVICDSKRQECLFMRQGNIGEAYTWPSTIESTPETVHIVVGKDLRPPGLEFKCEQIEWPDKYKCEVAENGHTTTTEAIRQNNTLRFIGQQKDGVITW